MTAATLSTAEMAERYKCFKRGTLEPSTTAFLEWRRRNKAKVPEPIKKGCWLFADVVKFETEKPWLNNSKSKVGRRRKPASKDIELRVRFC